MITSAVTASWLRNACLFVNCFLQTPMWSMVLCFTIYVWGLWTAPNAVIRYVLLFYTAICLLDRSAPTGSRRWVTYERVTWCRNVAFFRWVAQYFPVELLKTVDLDPSKRYIFLYQPHGIIGMGCNTALNTNGCDWENIFPGIRRWGVTLNVCFLCPFFREWLSLNGFVGAGRETLLRKLSTLNNDSIVLVPGGAAEALHTAPDKFQLVRRQGFLKLALETGALPVPCLGFGENSAFCTYAFAPGSAGFRVQTYISKWLTCSTPILTWPFCVRRPIHVVIGAPVPLSKGASVEACQQQYMAAVEELYHRHKDRFGYSDIQLEWL